MEDHIILIRRATGHDVELLAELGTETWINTYITNTYTHQRQSTTALTFRIEQFQEQLDDPAIIFLLAEIEGEAVGFAQMRDGDILKSITGPKPVEIERFYIRKAWTEQHVDSQLMLACISYARHYGFQTIWFSTWKYNQAVRALSSQWTCSDSGVYYTDILSEDRDDTPVSRCG